jgi:hypothetical protein
LLKKRPGPAYKYRQLAAYKPKYLAIKVKDVG